MTTHELKVSSRFFGPLKDGSKNFEVRNNDRDFRAGDTLRLREWVDRGGIYTGAEVERTVTYVLKDASAFGVRDGYAVLGLASRSTEGGPGWFWTQQEWSDWSNELALELPDRYDGDEAQESIILRFVKDSVAALNTLQDARAFHFAGTCTEGHNIGSGPCYQAAAAVKELISSA